jgi:hypothetical protein
MPAEDARFGMEARLRQLVSSAVCTGVLKDRAPTTGLTFVAIALVGAGTGAL